MLSRSFSIMSTIFVRLERELDSLERVLLIALLDKRECWSSSRCRSTDWPMKRCFSFSFEFESSECVDRIFSVDLEIVEIVVKNFPSMVWVRVVWTRLWWPLKEKRNWFSLEYNEREYLSNLVELMKIKYCSMMIDDLDETRNANRAEVRHYSCHYFWCCIDFAWWYYCQSAQHQ